MKVAEWDYSFWARAMPLATSISKKRFVSAFLECLDGLTQEAVDRKHHHVRNFDGYLDIRRETIGCKPVFAFIELELEIPDDVFNHRSLTHLRLWANEMICIANVSSNIFVVLHSILMP